MSLMSSNHVRILVAPSSPVKGSGLHEVNCLKVKVVLGWSALESTETLGLEVAWILLMISGKMIAIYLAMKANIFLLELCLELFPEFRLGKRLEDIYKIGWRE